jgi:hypothetical protein
MGRTYDRFGGFNSPDFDFLGEPDNFGYNAWEQVEQGYDGRLKAELGKISEFNVERAVKALGIKKVNSGSDLKQIREWLDGGGGGGNSAEGKDPSGFPRDTGDFDDIIGALGDDIAAANDRADQYANQATEDIANNTQVLNDQFNTRLAELTAGFSERYGALEDLLTTQQNSMTQFQTMMQGQMQAAQNSYNQQVSMMQNMQRAVVPEAEENAFSAQIGDQREDTSRTKENNRLSDLSILSGLGTAGSPTSGLSLA